MLPISSSDVRRTHGTSPVRRLNRGHVVVGSVCGLSPKEGLYGCRDWSAEYGAGHAGSDIYSILRILYNETSLVDRARGIAPSFMDLAQVAQQVGLDQVVVADLADELKSERLIDYMSLGRTSCVITPFGREKVEAAIRDSSTIIH